MATMTYVVSGSTSTATPVTFYPEPVRFTAKEYLKRRQYIRDRMSSLSEGSYAYDDYTIRLARLDRKWQRSMGPQ